MLKVLILDPNSSALADTDRCVKWAWAFWTRLGGVCQLVKATAPATAAVFTQQWDIIVVPWVRNVAGNYTTLQTMLGYVTDTSVPVYVVASDPSLSSAITSVTALNAAADALDMTRRMIAHYRTGSRPIPRVVSLACEGWEVRRARHAA